MQMHWDAWEAFGLLGESLFFSRLIFQWAASEEARRPVIPRIYWYMSLIGATILIGYALHIHSWVVLLPQIVGIMIYARQLALDIAHGRQAAAKAASANNQDRKWPSISVIVPAHNEEAALANTLAPLCAQVATPEMKLHPMVKALAGHYPGEAEIIVAMNGCTDNTRAVAEQFPVRVVESEKAGMSFGKNFGAANAKGEILIFVDADTLLPIGALKDIIEALGTSKAVATVGGKADKGGPVVRGAFMVANYKTRKAKLHAPGGVMAMTKALFEEVNGFDEALPQGTSSDFFMRTQAKGAGYVYVDSFKAVTSIRRFEKTGIISQLVAWRKNHKKLAEGKRQEVENSEYKAIR